MSRCLRTSYYKPLKLRLMKFFRLFLIAALMPLCFACEKESESREPPEPQTKTDLHKIPVEKALEELNTLLEAIDGPETRNGTARRVESVKSLRAADLARATRTKNAELPDIGDLVYIANFENGEGYAILGADDRIESVIAITEQGSLTPQQLAAAANGEYDGMEAPPVIPEVGDYLNAQFGGIHMYDSIKNPFPVGQTIYGPWEYVNKHGPYCKMKWGQGAPYNCKTRQINGTHCKVGCVAVAIAQIAATNYYKKYYPTNLNPEPTNIGGQPIFWSEIFSTIRRFTNDPNLRRYYFPDEDNWEIRTAAYFLSGVGETIGMNYGVNASSASDDDAVRFLKAMGFKDVKKYYCDEGKIAEMVVGRGLPTYVSGQGDKGHAWVVDGSVIQRRLATTKYTTGEVKENYQNNILYHCNFGWAGIADGYYKPNLIYCPSTDPVYKEDDNIDRYSGENKNYSNRTRIIYYNL